MQGKSRMTLLDVQAIVKELRAKVLGMRVANIYNLDNRTFQFKLKPASAAVRDANRVDDDDASAKIYLLMESGIRVHLTKYERAKNAMPSAFSMKLRKHLRGKRLSGVRQFGVDRVVDFKFGVGDTAFHIVLELHSGGNIILTDHEYNIKLVLRRHTYENAAKNVAEPPQKLQSADGKNKSKELARVAALSGVRVAVGEKYPMDLAVAKNASPDDVDVRALLHALWASEMERYEKWKQDGPHSKSFQSSLIRMELAVRLSVGQNIIENCLKACGVRAKVTLKDFGWDGDADDTVLDDRVTDEFVSTFISAYSECVVILERLATEPLPGYIEYKYASSLKRKTKTTKKSTGKLTKSQRKRMMREGRDPSSAVNDDEQKSSATNGDAGDDADDEKKKDDNDGLATHEAELDDTKLYTSFLPFLLKQHDNGDTEFIEYPTFNEAVDEYFSRLEHQKDEMRRLKHKASALDRVQRAKTEHSTRVQHLTTVVMNNARRAQLIELNLDAVQLVIDAMNAEVSNGASWDEIELIINEQKQQGNPVACLIKSMNLRRNLVTLQLGDTPVRLDDHDDDDDDDDNDDGDVGELYDVDVNITQSAFINAQRYYQAKKASQQKATRTVQASTKAIRAVERTTERALKAVDMSVKLQRMRKIHWFEKFHWFISSENYLVIGGKDAHQNEAVVRRYMKPHDIYVHGDFHGASSVIVKNPHTDKDVPTKTLIQAVTMCVCRSSAWNEKIANTGYWVRGNQVSKTAPTGEYLPTGSFMVRGERNYIPHTPLAMAMAIMFRVDESCVEFHRGERKCRQLDDDDDDGGVVSNNNNNPNDVSRVHSSSDHDDADAVDDDDNNDEDNDDNDEDDDESVVSASITAQFVSSPPRTPMSVTSSQSGNNRNKTTHTRPAKMSRAERRRLKKLKQKGHQDGDSVPAPPQQQQQQQPSSPSAKKPKGAPPKKMSKAKRRKMKMIAEKYGDRDEEELKLVESVLGIQMKTTTAAHDDDDDGDGVDDDNDERKNENMSERACYHCRELGHVFAVCPIRLAGLARDATATAATSTATDAGGGGGGETSSSSMSFAQAKKAAILSDERELRTLMEEENIAILADEKELSELDYFTGKPLPNDTILYPLVMCAPVSAVSDYKYKAKFVPGTGKRGKTAKTVVEMFCKQADANENERNLIKSVPVAELHDGLLSKIKLSVPSTSSGRRRRGGGGGGGGGKKKKYTKKKR